MGDALAPEIDLPRFRVDALVEAVERCREQHHFPLLEEDSVAFDVPGDHARRSDQREAAEQLFHGSLNLFRIIDQLCDLVRVAAEIVHDHVHEVGHGIEPGQQQQRDHAEHLVTAHRLPVDGAVHRDADQVGSVAADALIDDRRDIVEQRAVGLVERLGHFFRGSAGGPGHRARMGAQHERVAHRQVGHAHEHPDREFARELLDKVAFAVDDERIYQACSLGADRLRHGTDRPQVQAPVNHLAIGSVLWWIHLRGHHGVFLTGRLGDEYDAAREMLGVGIDFPYLRSAGRDPMPTVARGPDQIGHAAVLNGLPGFQIPVLVDAFEIVHVDVEVDRQAHDPDAGPGLPILLRSSSDSPVIVPIHQLDGWAIGRHPAHQCQA